ncbi:MAG: RecX family transcriptional regulator [bacterium]
MQVTALRYLPLLKKVAIDIDGKYSFSVLEDIVIREKIFQGKQLTAQEIINIKQELERETIYFKCIELIGRRPHSSWEVKQYLIKKGIDNGIIEQLIERLEKEKLISDLEFAKWWLQNRSQFKTRSRLELQKELQQKKIDSQIIEQVIQENFPENEEIKLLQELIARQEKRLLNRVTDLKQRNKKIQDYLLRRGFSWSSISKAFKN